MSIFPGRGTLYNRRYSLCPLWRGTGSSRRDRIRQDKNIWLRSKTLPDFVEEKTKGTYKSEEVVSVSLQELRSMEFDKIEENL